MTLGYKIFEVGYDPDTHTVFPVTLFHALRGSRRLCVGSWLEAEQKMVTDGSRQAKYRSGFHAYPDLETITAWLKNSKNNETRVVVRVDLRGVLDKPRAIRPTYLAQHMFISQSAWANRVPAQFLVPRTSTAKKRRAALN